MLRREQRRRVRLLNDGLIPFDHEWHSQAPWVSRGLVLPQLGARSGYTCHGMRVREPSLGGLW